MFGGAYKGSKLRVNLRLAINRLKLLQKKKTEQALKARKEIADYLKICKVERARIRVEHIIREDYMVEAMEVLEMYCDLLLARFGMIESMKYCDEGLAEAVCTLIWVAPRLQADIAEMKLIADQLVLKYGKAFGEQSRTNSNGAVNERVIHRMGSQPPPRALVEGYLQEIAQSHHIQFTPDESALQEDSMSASNEKGNLFPYDGRGGSPGFPNGPPPPFDGGSSGGGGGGGMIMPPHTAHVQPRAQGPMPTAMPYVPPPATSGAASSSVPQPSTVGQPSGPWAVQPPAGPMPGSSHMPPPAAASGGAPYPVGGQSQPPYPGQNLYINHPTHVGAPSGAPGGGMPSPAGPTAPFPDLPSVPHDTLPDVGRGSGGGGQSTGDDLDFDDLTRRFEDLKRKK